MDLYDAKHRVVSGPVFSVAYIDLPHAELGTWFAVRGLNEAHYRVESLCERSTLPKMVVLQ